MIVPKVGDWVRLPSIRPANWNPYGKMDHFLGKIVKVLDIRYSSFLFEGQLGWNFKYREIEENLGPDYDPDETQTIKNHYTIF